MTRANTQLWIIDDDQSIRWVLEKAFTKAGITTKTFQDSDSALEQLHHELPTIIITDIRMPGTNGIDFMKILNQKHDNIPVIVITAHSDLDSAVSAYQSGAFEYLPKPFDIDDIITVAKRAIAYASETNQRSTGISLPTVDEDPDIIGKSPAMQEVFRTIGRLSHSAITVLISGQSGTGKERVANALHQHSPRKNNAFITLNMAAIPGDLIESELFGHEKGAFTGADTSRQGRFEQADGGTLFLDEIGDMPPETQTRLLRVLANGEFYRVGGHTPLTVDVRIIAATHQNLEKLVKHNRFREDLYHRLNVIQIHIPALCERREDIPELARQFLKKAASDLEVEPKHLLPETEQYLSTLKWPGNVRQLENTCRRITIMAAGRDIHLKDLPSEIIQQQPAIPTSDRWEQHLRHWAEQLLTQGQKNILDIALPTFEKALIDVAMQQAAGRRGDASALLGWGRNTLSRKLKTLRIDDIEHTEKSPDTTNSTR